MSDRSERRSPPSSPWRVITYATRIAGIFLAGRLAPAGRAKAAFDAIPAAVLVAVIAPAALATGPAETVAAAVAGLAATRLPLLATDRHRCGPVVRIGGVRADRVSTSNVHAPEAV